MTNFKLILDAMSPAEGHHYFNQSERDFLRQPGALEAVGAYPELVSKFESADQFLRNEWGRLGLSLELHPVAWRELRKGALRLPDLPYEPPPFAADFFHYFNSTIDDETKTIIMAELVGNEHLLQGFQGDVAVVLQYLQEPNLNALRRAFGVGSKNLWEHVWSHLRNMEFADRLPVLPFFDLGLMIFELGYSQEDLMALLLRTEAARTTPLILARQRITREYVNLLLDFHARYQRGEITLAEIVRQNPMPTVGPFERLNPDITFWRHYLAFKREGETVNETYVRRGDFINELKDRVWQEADRRGSAAMAIELRKTSSSPSIPFDISPLFAWLNPELDERLKQEIITKLLLTPIWSDFLNDCDGVIPRLEQAGSSIHALRGAFGDSQTIMEHLKNSHLKFYGDPDFPQPPWHDLGLMVFELEYSNEEIRRCLSAEEARCYQLFGKDVDEIPPLVYRRWRETEIYAEELLSLRARYRRGEISLADLVRLRPVSDKWERDGWLFDEDICPFLHYLAFKREGDTVLQTYQRRRDFITAAMRLVQAHKAPQPVEPVERVLSPFDSLHSFLNGEIDADLKEEIIAEILLTPEVRKDFEFDCQTVLRRLEPLRDFSPEKLRAVFGLGSGGTIADHIRNFHLGVYTCQGKAPFPGLDLWFMVSPLAYEAWHVRSFLEDEEKRFVRFLKTQFRSDALPGFFVRRWKITHAYAEALLDIHARVSRGELSTADAVRQRPIAIEGDDFEIFRPDLCPLRHYEAFRHKKDDTVLDIYRRRQGLLDVGTAFLAGGALTQAKTPASPEHHRTRRASAHTALGGMRSPPGRSRRGLSSSLRLFSGIK
ncbi:MAG: hypothetical protein Q7T11_04445 [Deltaproteobacteria bacterium]|nr:hypothetical protein [Deltaproteobacteria bacterium]